MEIKEFRVKAKPEDILLIEGREYRVREVVKFKLDDGSFYYKCHLEGGYAFADDIEEDIFILVKKIDVPFSIPFPKVLNYDNKVLKFLYTAHAEAEQVWGEKVYDRGYVERFWDFRADDGSYLSLGVDDSNGEREDFYGKIVRIEDVKIK